MTQTACLPNTSQGCRKAPLQGAQAGLARSSFRVPRGLARGAAAAKGPRRSAAAAPARLVVCEAKPGSEEGVAAVGRDLSWSHVAADVKRRLGPVVAGKASSADQLQGWCAGSGEGR